MNNQEIFILILIVVLILLELYKCNENFESTKNNLSCDFNPLNSNCSCPPDEPIQKVIGKFPMNYGRTSPYVYKCYQNSTPEPSTNIGSTCSL